MCKKKKKFQVNERHILDKTKTEKRKEQEKGGGKSKTIGKVMNRKRPDRCCT
jgi:hypothetical protein